MVGVRDRDMVRIRVRVRVRVRAIPRSSTVISIMSGP